MICPNCGTENAAGSRFCDECGAALSAACPACGELHRPGAKFCANCGSSLGDATRAAAPVAAPAGPPSMAERRFVTVLFVDLVGFTPFAEDRDAELVRETLDKYFGIARLSVERHGGTIEKFIGDAVMAVWGTPTAHEDDAERAVRAAMELLDGVQGLGQGITARAGIVTGEAAVTIGAQGQGMVAGDLVNTASRLQSVAPPGMILVSAATMNAASAAIVFEPAGPQELKGKTAPVDAFRALRVVANRGGQNRSDALEAPFVGREEELRLLKEQLHATSRDQRARLVSISGPAGIGKSRLAWEFEKYVDGVVETVNWHRGRSPAYGEGITFWALGEMVRRRAQLAENDDEHTTRRRIAETVATFVNEPTDRAWVEPALLTLLGVEPAPSGGRDALFAAWRIFFERLADNATTVLLFEDLQWADSGLLEFIDHLLEWSKNRPILVVTLARPELFERRPDWGAGHRLLTALPLQPLPEQHMRALLEGLVPGLPREAVDAVLQRADGIPLYAVETVRMLVTEGRVELGQGGYRPTGDLRDLAVPETLRSLIASRLDGLRPADRSLLQDGSVLGQRFTVAALAALSGIGADEIEQRMRAMVRRELLDLEADPRSPERGQYGFVQSLIREVAYGTLARRERRNRHLAAARYYEALGDEELAGALATHYLAAHEASSEGEEADAVAAQARLALRAAASRAASLGAHAQAVGFVEQALEITLEPVERASLFEIAADSANASGQGEVGPRYARDAIDIYLAQGDSRSAIRSSALLGRILIDQGLHTEAIAAMEPMLSHGRSGADDDVLAALHAQVSRAYMRTDDSLKAIESADRALAIAERLDLEQVVAEAFINKGSALNQIGRRREAGLLHAKAVELAQTFGWVEMELRARNNLSVGQIDDDPRRALDTVAASLALAGKVGQRGMHNFLVGTVAMYQLAIGEDWDAVTALLEELLASDPPPFDRARASVILALYRALRGKDADEAINEAEAGRVSVSEPQVNATVGLVRIVANLLAGRYAEASQAIRHSETWSDFARATMPYEIRARAYAADIEGARAAARALEEHPATGRFMDGLRLAAAATVAALEGRRPDALNGLGAAIALLREIGAEFRAAELVPDALKLLPDDDIPAEWIVFARSVFERVSATVHLGLLEDLVDRRGSTPPTAATTQAGEVASPV